jgi:hypothetical protein
MCLAIGNWSADGTTPTARGCAHVAESSDRRGRGSTACHLPASLPPLGAGVLSSYDFREVAIVFEYTCPAPDCRMTVTGLGYRRRDCHGCGTPVAVEPASPLSAARVAFLILRAPFVRELAENGRGRATRRAAYHWLVSYQLARTWGRVGDRQARQKAAADWEHYAPASADQVLAEALGQQPRQRQAILTRLLAPEPTAPPTLELADVFHELSEILGSSPAS